MVWDPKGLPWKIKGAGKVPPATGTDKLAVPPSIPVSDRRDSFG